MNIHVTGASWNTILQLLIFPNLSEKWKLTVKELAPVPIIKPILFLHFLIEQIVILLKDGFNHRASPVACPF